MNKITEKAAKVKLLILDVDGVLTDGTLYFGADDGNEETKGYNIKDGLGLVLLKEAGIEVAVITGRKSKSVSNRLKGLGITQVYQGQLNKAGAYSELLDKLGLKAEQTAYIGDDLIDLPILTKAGLAIAVKDAHAEVLSRVDMITDNIGGNGAVREVCDLLLKSQELYEGILNRYLEM
ncbi:MAG: 3-deoxy-manno-octulosonate-8-phosphatase KdsC [Gammaproteobacteria bacterium]|nr:MAG: 3-deoxy-manno-octulosonate-8-phosphatase KdsC [Gammaproteobacteria bacterium]